MVEAAPFTPEQTEFLAALFQLAYNLRLNKNGKKHNRRTLLRMAGVLDVQPRAALLEMLQRDVTTQAKSLENHQPHLLLERGKPETLRRRQTMLRTAEEVFRRIPAAHSSDTLALSS